jgi:UDP-N-acetylglucosamine 4,6-dehydratase
MTKHLFQTRFATQLLSLPRTYKRLIVIANDVFLLLLALWASFSLRLGFIFVPMGSSEWLSFLAAPVIIIACLQFSGAYRRINRYVGRTGAQRTLTGLVLGVLIWSLIIFLSGIDVVASHGIPRSIPLIYLALSFLFIWSNREFASWYLTSSFTGNTGNADKDMPVKKILIWGYSKMALQLAHNLKLVDGYDPVGIIDEDESLHFLKADDIKIFPPNYLDVLIPKEQISEIFHVEGDKSFKPQRV